MLIEFQPMDLEHIPQVLAIEDACFTNPWTEMSFVYEIMQNSFADYLVALCQEEVVGYGGLWLVLDEAHITNVAVRPDMHRRGIGRRIMEKLLARSAFLGARRVTLEVRVSNHAARTLYTTLGFEERGIRRRYYNDNGEDAIIMWLDFAELKKNIKMS